MAIMDGAKPKGGYARKCTSHKNTKSINDVQRAQA